MNPPEDIAPVRINNDGILLIHVRQYHTQEQNRFDAEERLVEIIKQALVKPTQRKKTPIHHSESPPCGR